MGLMRFAGFSLGDLEGPSGGFRGFRVKGFGVSVGSLRAEM